LKKIFGHRGLPRIYKENTFTGINKAYEHCDFVEIDVRLTGDNQLILHHDPNIGEDLIKNLSLSESLLVFTITTTERLINCTSKTNMVFVLPLAKNVLLIPILPVELSRQNLLRLMEVISSDINSSNLAYMKSSANIIGRLHGIGLAIIGFASFVLSFSLGYLGIIFGFDFLILVVGWLFMVPFLLLPTSIIVSTTKLTKNSRLLTKISLKLLKILSKST
jgi:hypothetical protein